MGESAAFKPRTEMKIKIRPQQRDVYYNVYSMLIRTDEMSIITEHGMLGDTTSA